MSPWKTASRLVGAVLCTLAFAATALADPGNGNGDENGNGVGIGIGGTPPGQELNAQPPTGSAEPPAEAPAAAAAAAEAKQANGDRKDERQAAKDERKAAKDGRKAAKTDNQPPKAQPQRAAKKPKPDKTRDDATPASSPGRSAEAHHHVIVCHRTGSDSNPYVVINIPLTAWRSGHSRHGDVLLKDPASRPGAKDGLTKDACEAPAGTLAQATRR